MIRKIFVTHQFESMHCWPEAPEQVAFLRNPHRHMFHVRVTMTVEHNDRDVEFILLKREIEAFTSSQISNKLWPISSSCERMAEEILKYLKSQYPGRSYKVEVSEDGENGAILSEKNY